MGADAYQQATELLMTADGFGLNGSRRRLWQRELQRFADETGLKISVCHFPPGTSFCPKIEHRMFSHMTKNWRGRPLTSPEVIVNLIANTTTHTGLKIQAVLDTGEYPTGIKVSFREMKTLQRERNAFHGNWNDTIIADENR